MCAAPVLHDELTRRRALRALDILDSPPEAVFDALAQTAALICEAPIALISLIDEARQWFKANVGLPGLTETSREIAFCAHAIRDEGLFEIPDAAMDPRFANNPLVTGDPKIRFFAGVTLCLRDGAHIGTLCVIDRRPRQLDPRQRESLRHLAAAAVSALETRHAIRDLAASEAKYRALSEASPLGVFSTDATGRCVYTNSRWQAIFGLTMAQSLGYGWSNTLHPEDRDAVTTEWGRAALARREFNMPFRVQHPTGEVYFVHTRARPVLDANDAVTGHVGTVEDVTARKHQDAALAKGERSLRRTGDLAGVGGWELDIASQAAIWSDQTCNLLGFEPGYQPTLREAFELCTLRARPVVQAAVERALALSEPFDLELQLVTKDARHRWVRVVGHADAAEPGRIVGAMHDITERVEQRQALEVANERMALAALSGNIGIWDCDLASGKVTWDARMLEIYGLPASTERLNYERWAGRLHPADRVAAEIAFQDVIAGASPFKFEFRIVLDDGSVRHILNSGVLQRDAAGRPLRMIGMDTDVTELRQLSAALAAEHELLQVTLRSIGDAVITTDGAGCVTWLNPVAERMTGWPTTEAKGRPLVQVFNIVNEETRQPTENPVAACLQHGKVVGLADHTVLIARNGEEFGIEDSAAPIRHANGEVLGVVLVFHDVTEQRRMTGEMNYRATHDALTRLVNRAEFETRLRRVLHHAHEHGSEHALLYIDLDQFKLVNDACGHSVGDQLLQQVSKLLQEAVRSRDTLARLGGDEFGVILEHCATVQAERVAQQICERMDDFRFQHDERRFRIGASIGLVALDNRWATPATVMQAADTACYAAKEAGRNRVHTWFDTDLAMRARQGEMQWATRIEQALDEDRFVLFAQRFEAVNPSAYAGLHAEVLVRMIDLDGSLVLPGAFLPATERFHLAPRFDRWVLRRAINTLAALPDLAPVDTLCINISGQSVGDRVFHRHAIETLREAGPPVCRRICLEITETAAVTNLADAALFIAQVRNLGVRVALDDFGAGASSFGYLKTLAVDLLKIDGQFITDLLDDPLDDVAVRCFVDIARVIGVKTIAEFVERPEVLEHLRKIGVDYAQGFLLHRPEPIEAVFQRLPSQSRHRALV